MKKKKHICLIVVMLALIMGSPPIQVNASEIGRTEGEERSLIQSINEQNELEGMLELGLFKIKPLQVENIEKALELVEPTIVGVNVSEYAGSGTIISIEKERVIIASSKHLLMYGSDAEVTFFNNIKVKGEILNLSEQYDIGFIEVSMPDIPYPLKRDIRAAHLSQEAADKVTYGTEMFLLGSADGVAENRSFGTVVDPWEYFEEFQSYMLHNYCYGKKGMSGCGTFDAYGNYIGMLTGGLEEHTASLPLAIILEEQESVLNQLG